MLGKRADKEVLHARRHKLAPAPPPISVVDEPDQVMLYFCPSVLQSTAHRFQHGFPGLVTYAVKANAGDEVLSNLVAAGIQAFDVASPAEMRAVRAVCPHAALHYNNPVRSLDEIAVARSLGVQSYSVDCLQELEKLGDLPGDTEISVRLALPIAGAVYDFGSKFGVGPEAASGVAEECCRSRFATFDHVSSGYSMCRSHGLAQLY